MLPNLSTQRRLGDSSINEQDAKAACEAAGHLEGMHNCVFDIIATGDLETAAAGL